ncbi:MAG: BamA/TamA family outer membrane protein [Myxococcales bacterium]|nr:BamA/TamA family outer membrane protein [Myxococcales bacterium]
MRLKAPSLLALPLLSLALAACGGTPHPKPILGEVPEIDDVRFEGVTRFSKGKLIEHLHLGETSWVPLSPDHHLNEALVPVDARRIEALYAAHGYHGARVLDLHVERDDDEVDLVIRVAEGEPTLLDKVVFEWAAGAGLDPMAREALQATAPLQPGQPFEVPVLNDTLGLSRLRLQAWGYPLARVVGDATVNPGARTARATVHLDPGPYARVGRVVVEGLVDVPEDLVLNEVAFARGEQFSPGLMRSIAHTAKGMDVFRWVTVQPADAVEKGLVDVRLRVNEADPQTIRLGVRGVFEAARWEQQLVARYTHTNLFKRLVRLDLDVLAGWAELPDPVDPEAHGPVVTVQPKFTKKGWLEDHLLWTLRPRFDLDIQPGYKFWSPSGAFGVGRWFGHFLRADVSYNIAYVDFFQISPALDQSTTQLGLDFRDPYLLPWIRFVVDLPLVDDMNAPQNGAMLRFTYDLAGGPLLGDFDFHKLLASWRGFWRPWSWLQWAARAEGGLILGYGDTPGAPLDRKFYLGGANTVRAWGTRQLSPRLEEDPSVPAGGQTMVLGNLEARIPLGKLALVAFYDVGDVQAGELTFTPAEWNHTAGPGLRYDSPVGLVRLDVGFRLNDPGVYDGVPGWGVHFGFGEAF